MDLDTISNGDAVTLTTDDWNSLCGSMIIVDREPVPGSTQCLVKLNGEERTVSRAILRPLPAR